MRKTFPLESPAHDPARVIESIKHDIRKYLKRERRKPLPDTSDYWDFACRVGPAEESAELLHEKEIPAAIDRTAADGAKAVYVEILAKAAHRTAREG